MKARTFNVIWVEKDTDTVLHKAEGLEAVQHRFGDITVAQVLADPGFFSLSIARIGVTSRLTR